MSDGCTSVTKSVFNSDLVTQKPPLGDFQINLQIHVFMFAQYRYQQLLVCKYDWMIASSEEEDHEEAC